MLKMWSLRAHGFVDMQLVWRAAGGVGDGGGGVHGGGVVGVVGVHGGGDSQLISVFWHIQTFQI